MAPTPKAGKKALSKPSTLVYDAIDALRGMTGASLNEITNYIAGETLFPKEIIEEHVKLAIKKGISYGVLKKTGTRYTVHQDDEETERLLSSHRHSGKAKRTPHRSASGKRSKRRKSSTKRSKRRKSSTKRSKRRKSSSKRSVSRRRSSRLAVKRRRSSSRRKSVKNIVRGHKVAVKRRGAVAVKGRRVAVKGRKAAVKGRKVAVKRRRTVAKKTVKRRRSRSRSPRRASPRH